MKIRFRLLDVFTEVPFAGNTLCVVPETPAGVDEGLMLAITREINFSETTFVTAVRDGGYDVRIFTPEKELPFAGHPTLGTAFTLVSEGRVSSPVVHTSAAGDVPVEVDLEAQPRTPAFAASSASAIIAACSAGSAQRARDEAGRVSTGSKYR